MSDRHGRDEDRRLAGAEHGRGRSRSSRLHARSPDPERHEDREGRSRHRHRHHSHRREGPDDEDSERGSRSRRHHRSHGHGHGHHRSGDDGRSRHREPSADETGRPVPAAAARAEPAVRHHARAVAPEEQISQEDYYARGREFRAWLAATSKPCFGDLDGKAAREMFGEFCSLWNAGGLPADYYLGKMDADLADSGRTSFKWGFVNRLGDEERMRLLATRDSVQVESDKSATLVDEMAGAREERERKQQRKEAWERREAERAAVERADREEAMARAGRAGGGGASSSVAAEAIAVSRRLKEPSTADIMAQLGLKEGQTVTMKPRADGE